MRDWGEVLLFVAGILFATWSIWTHMRDTWNAPRPGEPCGSHHHWRAVGDAFSGSDISCEDDDEP